MLNLYYRVWGLLHKKKLGAMGYMPVPSIVKRILSRYPLQMQIVKYTQLMEGQKAWVGVPQELACANSVTGILEMIDPSFFGGLYTIDRIDSTIRLGEAMQHSKRFLNLTGKLPEPVNGCIVLNRTVGKNIGHTGIYINGKVYNNNSDTGKWVPTYTWLAWQIVFLNNKGLKTELYYPLPIIK